MNGSLILRDDLTIRFAPQAEELKDQALTVAALIGKVTNANENREAVEAQSKLYAVSKSVEESRKAVKAPILDFGRKIDETAKQFVQELRIEEERISGLIGNFQELEKARLKSEESARMKCLTELESKRESELAEATTFEQRDEIQARYSEEIGSIPIAQPIRAEGQVVRDDWEIEVVNEWLLAKDHPNCVKITPKISEIKSLLNAGFKVNGIRASKKISASVRLQKEQKSIEV